MHTRRHHIGRPFETPLFQVPCTQTKMATDDDDDDDDDNEDDDDDCDGGGGDDDVMIARC